MKQNQKIGRRRKISALLVLFGTIAITLLLILTLWKSVINGNGLAGRFNSQDSSTNQEQNLSPPPGSKRKGNSLVVYFLHPSGETAFLTLYGTIIESPIPLHWLDGWARLGDHYGDDSKVISTISFEKTEDTYVDTSNLLVSVDLIWTSHQGKDVIVDMIENVPPKTPFIHKPSKNANGVLAIPAGFVKKCGIRVGDFVNYSG